MRVLLLSLSLLFFVFPSLFQVALSQVGIGTTSPDVRAALDISSTTQGFLPPRMTTAQRTTLGGTLTLAHEGMILYDTSKDSLFVWRGAAWYSFAATNPINATSNYAFRAKQSTGTAAPDNATIKINFDTAPINVGGHFNTSLARYVAPMTGQYSMSFSATSETEGNDSEILLIIKVNNIEVQSTSDEFEKQNYNYSLSLTGVFQLNAGDYIEFHFKQTCNGSGTATINAARSSFSGFLIR
jgi:hypothetical protein